jgi:hypothetical protein
MKQRRLFVFAAGRRSWWSPCGYAAIMREIAVARAGIAVTGPPMRMTPNWSAPHPKFRACVHFWTFSDRAMR